MKGWLFGLVGFVLGIAVCAVVVVFVGPGLMIQERASPLGLEETVKRITDAAAAEGWVVQPTLELEKSIREHGGGEVRPVRLVNLCEPNHAARILGEDDARRVSVLMPCTIAVYQKADGKVYVSTMNPGILARLFGGVVSEVMGGPVAEAQQRFVDAVR